MGEYVCMGGTIEKIKFQGYWDGMGSSCYAEIRTIKMQGFVKGEVFCQSYHDFFLWNIWK